jgi:hypothetical protein
VPAALASWVGAKLAQHGIEFRKLRRPIGAAVVETFRAEQTSFGNGSFEGHQTLTVGGTWKAEPRPVAAGSLFVPIGQAKSMLVMSLLEPLAPDSLLAWGQFNNAFERKEYLEDYVAEDVAREQLSADPVLAAEFRKRLESDTDFAKDARARLEFFARRHPSWDERFNLYPVMRIDRLPD